MLGNVGKLAAVFAAIAGAVMGATMFSTSPGNTTAAQGVMVFGLMVFGFTLLISIGGIIAGVLEMIGGWREGLEAGHHKRAGPA